MANIIYRLVVGIPFVVGTARPIADVAIRDRVLTLRTAITQRRGRASKQAAEITDRIIGINSDDPVGSRRRLRRSGAVLLTIMLCEGYVFLYWLPPKMGL